MHVVVLCSTKLYQLVKRELVNWNRLPLGGALNSEDGVWMLLQLGGVLLVLLVPGYRWTSTWKYRSCDESLLSFWLFDSVLILSPAQVSWGCWPDQLDPDAVGVHCRSYQWSRYVRGDQVAVFILEIDNEDETCVNNVMWMRMACVQLLLLPRDWLLASCAQRCFGLLAKPFMSWPHIIIFFFIYFLKNAFVPHRRN